MNLEKYNKKSQTALVESQKLARTLNHQAIEPEHLLYSLIEDEDVVAALKRTGGKALPTALKALVESELTKFPQVSTKNNYLSPLLTQVFSKAETLMIGNGQKLVDVLHLMQAIVLVGGKASQVLRNSGISAENFGVATVSSKAGQVSDKDKENSAIAKFCTNLVDQARAGNLPTVVGREAEVQKLVQVLLCHGKNNAILVGKSGVGKTSIIRALAQRIAAGKVHDILRDKNIYSLDLGALLAGATLRGQFEERMKSLFTELKDSGGQSILLIDDIDGIVGAGGEGASDASSILKTALSNGELQILGTAGPDGFRNKIEKDKALVRWFQSIQVEEPSFEETVQILKGVCLDHEKHHKVHIAESAMSFAAKFGKRYFAERQLPDIAIDIVDLATSRMKTKNPTAHELTMDDVAAYISEATGIPTGDMAESEKEKLLRLEKVLGERVINQQEALTAIGKAIRRSRVGLGDVGRPTGSFFFLGSSGCGKTETAKALAQFLFDDQEAMVRIDMAEFAEEHTVSKLIGSPPGYKGSDEGGLLTEAVRRKPYSVVLFDECEKAAPRIFDILLSILDDGRITDSQGRLVNFKNTVIILTSNIGSPFLLESCLKVGSVTEDARQQAFDELRKKFRPEFIGRLDEIIFFNSITRENLTAIADIQIKKIVSMLSMAYKIYLLLTPEAKDFIVSSGFDPRFGARSLKRSIQVLLQDPLSTGILEDRFVEGSTIRVLVQNNQLAFSSSPTK